MKQISFISIHPDFLTSYLSFGIFHSAKQKNILNFNVINLRDFAVDRHGSVDDSPYGGGDGMVLRPEPLADALKSIEQGFVVFLSPRGQLWTQKKANTFHQSYSVEHLIFVCGRFAGVDQRFIDQYVDLEISIGDFIVSGGELPALIVADSILRNIPGVLGHEDSAKKDSFAEGFDGMLEHDLFTRPAIFEEKSVPQVLLSGDHKKIQDWKKQNSLEKTKKSRPDLFNYKP